MPDARSDLVRQRLHQLAERRDQHLTTGEALAQEVRDLVADAQAVGLPLAEVARVLRMDRSAMYRTYVKAA